MGQNQEILLETGTNEVEILEFFLNDQSFGINVAKVLQIICFDKSKLTELPKTPKGIMGTLLVQGKSVTLLDLGVVLNQEQAERVERPIVLVTNFNNVTNGFIVDGG